MYKIYIVILALARSLAMQVRGATIPVTYNFAGGPTGPPVMVGATLIVDGLFTGSVFWVTQSERCLESGYVQRSQRN